MTEATKSRKDFNKGGISNTCNGEPDLEEIKKRFHYLNTQPLWATENISKGSRYVG